MFRLSFPELLWELLRGTLLIQDYSLPSFLYFILCDFSFIFCFVHETVSHIVAQAQVHICPVSASSALLGLQACAITLDSLYLPLSAQSKLWKRHRTLLCTHFYLTFCKLLFYWFLKDLPLTPDVFETVCLTDGWYFHSIVFAEHTAVIKVFPQIPSHYFSKMEKSVFWKCL